MMLFSNLYENYIIASSSPALVSVKVLRRYDNHFRRYWANSVFLLVSMKKKNYWTTYNIADKLPFFGRIVHFLIQSTKIGRRSLVYHELN